MTIYTVKVRSENKYSELEWEQIFESHSKRSARAKATRWIRQNVAESDYSSIEKNRGTLIDFWYLEV